MLDENQSDCGHRYIFFGVRSAIVVTPKNGSVQAHTVLGNPPMHDVSGVKPKPPELEYKFMWH